MKTAIMQPYFMPYIGYWQLIFAVDQFIVYDNIEYTKKGWFNRNRILDGDHDRLFTIPVKKDSDFLPVNQRYLANDSASDIRKTLRIIQNTYRKAPNFEVAYPLIEKCFLFPQKNLFDYIYFSIKEICAFLNMKTEIIVSSTIAIDHELKADKKVLALCHAVGTTTYINAIGGVELYDKFAFQAEHISLQFLKPLITEYPQLGGEFVPFLSIIDVLMFNTKEDIRVLLHNYSLE